MAPETWQSQKNAVSCAPSSNHSSMHGICIHPARGQIQCWPYKRLGRDRRGTFGKALYVVQACVIGASSVRLNDDWCFWKLTTAVTPLEWAWRSRDLCRLLSLLAREVEPSPGRGLSTLLRGSLAKSNMLGFSQTLVRMIICRNGIEIVKRGYLGIS